jgi:hypothetical protein
MPTISEETTPTPQIQIYSDHSNAIIAITINVIAVTTSHISKFTF